MSSFPFFIEGPTNSPKNCFTCSGVLAILSSKIIAAIVGYDSKFANLIRKLTIFFITSWLLYLPVLFFEFTPSNN